MKTGLYISSQKFLASLLIVIAVTLSTIYAPVALQATAGLQVGTPLYACSGHSSGGGDC